MLVNQGNLIKAGYSPFEDCLNKSNETYLKSYQKAFENEIGVEYRLTIDFYDLSSLNSKLGIQFQSHCQFNLKNDFTFNVEGLNSKGITIDELESFYDKIWTSMDCQYRD